MTDPTPKRSLYDVIGVDSKATKEEIKEALDMMALRHHPDKNRGEMSGQEAYELSLARDILLKDDVRRAYYDLQNGFVADNEQERRRLHRMRRNVVMDTEETLASSAQSNREREAGIKGLVIVEARYGNLDPATQTVGSYINVTDAVQALVSNSGLIIPPNLVKSLELDGFYSPTADADTNELYIRYRFLDKMHECIVGEVEELRMPIQEHLIEESSEDQKEWESRFRAGGEITSEKRIKRRRRVALYSSVAVAVTSFLLRKQVGSLFGSLFKGKGKANVSS